MTITVLLLLDYEKFSNSMTFISANFLTNLLISGVQLLADPNMLNATEGERRQICVTIQDDDPSRERSVGISFGLYPMGNA